MTFSKLLLTAGTLWLLASCNSDVCTRHSDCEPGTQCGIGGVCSIVQDDDAGADGGADDASGADSGAIDAPDALVQPDASEPDASTDRSVQDVPPLVVQLPDDDSQVEDAGLLTPAPDDVGLVPDVAIPADAGAM